MTDTATTEVRPSSRPTSTVDDVTAPPRARHWAALPVLLSGTFLIVLDFFIVNVALPSMASDLHASAAAVEWVVAGYGLSVAVLLLAAGRLGDQWGRRRLFSIGIGA